MGVARSQQRGWNGAVDEVISGKSNTAASITGAHTGREAPESLREGPSSTLKIGGQREGNWVKEGGVEGGWGRSTPGRGQQVNTARTTAPGGMKAAVWPHGRARRRERANTGGKVGRSQTTCDPVHQGRDLDCVLRAAGGRVGFSTGSKVTGLHIRKFIGCSGGN